MTTADSAIHDEESAENRLLRHLHRTMREARKLSKDTHKEENAIKKHDRKKELKFDKKEEQDLSILFHDLILTFRDLIRITRDQGKVEEKEGKRAVKIHDAYKGKIEQELGYLMREIRTIRGIEHKE
ncbi:MAG: hypothetical protein ACQESE_02400 [Nanobdellota archaeon]